MLSASLNKGVLSVGGTGGNDAISLSLSSKNAAELVVRVNNQVNTFAKATVRSIQIDAGAGNDSVRIVEKWGALGVPIQIVGGVGNDTLSGSSGADDLQGGDGNDQLFGGLGDDTLWGGRGADRVDGQGGNDLVRGDAGNDVLAGAAGNDQVYGGAGNDTLDGGDGNDTLGGDEEDRIVWFGRKKLKQVVGDDVLRGGKGNDWLLGGTQTDTLIPGSDRHGDDGDEVDDDRFAFANGRDTMLGGAGRDILDARGGDDVLPDRAKGDLVPYDKFTNDLTNADDYAVHEHIILRVYINGMLMEIPVGFGEFGAPVIHKDPGSGRDTVHLHDVLPHRFTLGEVFMSMGISLSPSQIGQYRAGNGHTLTMTVNGVANNQFGNYRIVDEDRIEIRWQ